MQMAGAVAVGEVRAWIPLLGIGALVHKMVSEEALLVNLHGQLYESYMLSVPWRIAPFIW